MSYLLRRVGDYVTVKMTLNQRRCDLTIVEVKYGEHLPFCQKGSSNQPSINSVLSFFLPSFLPSFFRSFFSFFHTSTKSIKALQFQEVRLLLLREGQLANAGVREIGKPQCRAANNTSP